MSHWRKLLCLDSEEMAATRRKELDISRDFARSLGRSAVVASTQGAYQTASGERVIWQDSIESAGQKKISIPPDAKLPDRARPQFAETTVQVANETTLATSRRLADKGQRPLALNFANGIHPGGGFLNGARAQEEGLCRSSALFHTLVDDQMYDAHRQRPLPDSTDWAILSPDVPVFRADDGTELSDYWLLSVITSAAPVASHVGQPASGDLLQKRIHRVLAIAQAYEYTTLVLGAWGCGAFGNDVARTARDFYNALTSQYSGAFADVVFAIADWSPERRFLGPFRDVFSAGL
jgi:uncharacterized protein (TIGR02452 family)